MPFYFQPTLGGSDINGQRLLSGYDDYRFRGANLIALQESVEHSIWGPIGAYLLVEQGKVTAEGEGLGLSDLAHSFAVGLTLRAGGFPAGQSHLRVGHATAITSSARSTRRCSEARAGRRCTRMSPRHWNRRLASGPKAHRFRTT